VVEAATYTVAPAGSGTACTQAAPCALDTGLDRAQAGDEVVLLDGTYTSGVTLSRSGTAAQPIVIRSQHQGGARFSNAAIVLAGNDGQVQGVIMEGRGIAISGHHNRVSRTLFRNTSGTPAIEITGTGSFNRVDYNEITNWNGYGIRLRQPQDGMTGNRFDHNYIHDNPQVSNAEAIKLGDRPYTNLNLGTLIAYNLLEGIATDEDNEIISIKSSGNTIFANTFRNSEDNTLTIRHGAHNVVKNNTFINIHLGKYGDEHEIIGNRVVNGNIQVTAGDCTQEEVATGGGCYPVARRWLVAGNVVENGSIIVGAQPDRPLPVEDAIVAGNQGPIQLLHETGTQVRDVYDGDVGQPVLLTPDMVGPDAPGDGDLDGDGVVTLADLRLLLAMLLGQAAPSLATKALAEPTDQLTLLDGRELVRLLTSP
jgi:hypothetical protein